MDTDLSKTVKNDFGKHFFKLRSNEVCGKTMENVMEISNFSRWRNYLVSEPNFHTTMFFAENVLVIEMIKTDMLIK